jgi:hypothetical protein
MPRELWIREPRRLPLAPVATVEELSLGFIVGDLFIFCFFFRLCRQVAAQRFAAAACASACTRIAHNIFAALPICCQITTPPQVRSVLTCSHGDAHFFFMLPSVGYLPVCCMLLLIHL